MAKPRKTIITCAVTGAIHTPSMSQYLPVSASEIAEAAIAAAEADIVHMGMTDEAAQDALDLRFVITVRDREHLDTVLRHLRRTQSVLRAARIMSAVGGN